MPGDLSHYLEQSELQWTISGGALGTARNEVWFDGTVGFHECQRPGYGHSTECGDLSVEHRLSTSAARSDRDWSGLLGEPQHAPAMGGNWQPRGWPNYTRPQLPIDPDA